MKSLIALMIVASFSAGAQDLSQGQARKLAEKCLKKIYKVELNQLNSTAGSSFMTLGGEEVITLNAAGEDEALNAVYQISNDTIYMMSIHASKGNNHFIMSGLSNSKSCQTILE